MDWYARSSRRLVGQLVADVGVLVWVLGWLWVSRLVDGAIRGLAEPVRGIGNATSQVADDVARAGDRIGQVPLLGPDMSSPFTAASSRLDKVVADAERQAAAIDRMATSVGLAVFLLPVLVVLAVWLPVRLRFVRRARAARRLLAEGLPPDVFAWRALVHQPLTVVAATSKDPVGDLRRGRPEVVDALARAELRDCGIEWSSTPSR